MSEEAGFGPSRTPARRRATRPPVATASGQLTFPHPHFLTHKMGAQLAEAGSQWAQGADARCRRRPRGRRVVRSRGISVSGPKPSPHRRRRPEGRGRRAPALSGPGWGVFPAPWPLLCPVPVGPPDPASQRARKGHPRSPPLTPLESQREKRESSGSLVRAPAGPGAMSLTESFVRPRAKEPEGAGPDCLLLRFPTWVSPMRILGLALRPPVGKSVPAHHRCHSSNVLKGARCIMYTLVP